MGVAAPGEPDGSTEGLKDFLAPPSMAQYGLQSPRQSLSYPERGLLLTGEAFSPTEKTRYWGQGDLRAVSEVTGNKAVGVRLGHQVAAGHLPTKYLLTLKVVDATTGKFVGYECPCGTFLTTSSE